MLKVIDSSRGSNSSYKQHCKIHANHKYTTGMRLPRALYHVHQRQWTLFRDRTKQFMDLH
jgi:hypothetical protein